MMAKKLNCCQAYWSLYLAHFDFTLVHCPCHDLAKWLSYYLYFFSFLFLFSFHLDLLQGRSMGKCYITNVIHHGHMLGYHKGHVT